MASNLGFALLSLLARRAATGYELAQRLDRPLGYFWTAGHSQIYPELARLTSLGLVTYREEPGRGSGPNKRYDVTAEGLEELRSCVLADHSPPPVRDLDTMRLWSAWTVDPDHTRQLVHDMRERRAARLSAYESEQQAILDDPGAFDPAHPLFASRLTLEGGIRSARTDVEWCDWMLRELTAAQRGTAPRDTGVPEPG